MRLFDLSGTDRTQPNPCDISDEPRTNEPGQLVLFPELVAASSPSVLISGHRTLTCKPLREDDWTLFLAQVLFRRFVRIIPDPEEVYHTLLEMKCPLDLADKAWDFHNACESLPELGWDGTPLDSYNDFPFDPSRGADAGAVTSVTGIEAIPGCQPPGNGSSDSRNAPLLGSLS